MTQRTCPTCGGEVPASARRPRIYCSKPCGQKASRINNIRLCSIKGCTQPHGARGMCYSHYGSWHRRQNGRASNSPGYPITCIVCGADHLASRPTGKFCSDICKGRHYSATRRTKCELPSDHPVMALIRDRRIKAKEEAALQRRDRSLLQWRTARECPGCACLFTPLYTPNMLTCSKRCQRRVARWRRNAAERNAVGTFTWSEFMRVARRFDYTCAYCGTSDGQLDPDHVVPLSRGGLNSTTNLLPSCRSCNGDKRDLLLHEWAADRAARGKPLRTTSWAPDDTRYRHLTQALLLAA